MNTSLRAAQGLRARRSGSTPRGANRLFGILAAALLTSSAPLTPSAHAEGAAPEPLGLRASIAISGQLQSNEPQRTLLTIATMEYALGRGFGAIARVGWVHDSPEREESAWGVSNVLVGGSYRLPLGGNFAATARLGVVIPVGTGGGDAADPSDHRAMLAATDWGGPLFAPNHLAIAPGMQASYGRGRFFIDVRSTLYQVFRSRGERVDPIGPSLTFTASGLAAGITLPRSLTLVGGVAQTRYFGAPEFLGGAPAAKDDHYLLAGIAWERALGPTTRLRPTLVYVRAVDRPKSDRAFQLLEFDLAVTF